MSMRPLNNRTVIIQSNYIPWKGYFDLLAHADTVVLLDTVQSTKNDWRNRNQIKVPSGKAWLTIPVAHSNKMRIREVTVTDARWWVRHYRTLAQNYAKAPFASWLLPQLMEWYTRAGEFLFLSEINRVFLREILTMLGVDLKIVETESLLSIEEHDRLDPTLRLVEICKRVGATIYISGPSARSYLAEAAFIRENVEVVWFDYSGYVEYPQLHGAFDHNVSILDVFMMVGPQARDLVIRGDPNSLQRGGK